MPVYYQYWGKTNKENNYHLLPYHCLDVAAVAHCYLASHQYLLQSLSMASGLSLEQTCDLVVFFIALHDLGKFSICFQSKAPEVLQKLSPHSKKRENINYCHDVLGQALWQSILADLFIKKHISYLEDTTYIKNGFLVLMGASTGHHGLPTVVNNKNIGDCMAAFDSADIEAATGFYEAISALLLSDNKFDLNFYNSSAEFITRCQRLSWWLSGLTILSDWLGSNIGYFSYQQKEICLKDYWVYANKKARQALAESSLQQVSVKTHQSFQTLFGKPALRPLQQLAATLPLGQQEQLFILEDVTGAGKTEAALLLAYRMMAENLADGMYFALPTMATANGIYDRLKDLYQHFFDDPKNVSIILAHANNKFMKTFSTSVKFHPEEDKQATDELITATAFCNAWIADNHKKALLAHIGVGTIDQALQGVLKTKHQSLRLLGLFRKILIIDEVHAYDSYMQGLLEGLLRFHAASGGSVILLSATLPEKTRKNLINAFYKGRYDEPVLINLKKRDIYPLITHVCIEEEIKEIPVLSESKREVEIYLTDDGKNIEKYILEKLTQGQCVCWIRNTVHDAIEAYQKFKLLYSPEKTLLFHARFTQQDRAVIEEKVKNYFGEKSLAQERKGRLLIATQVVEQSLDLDFDCMITDLAPIDLIIQRAGRLQRHNRGKRASPVLMIYGPLPEEDITPTWYSHLFPKASYVYPNHAELWTGAKLLADKGKLVMPDDARYLVESVYNDETASRAPACLQDSADKYLGKQLADKSYANEIQIKLNNGYQRISEKEWQKNTRASTRLNDIETITVFLANYAQEKLHPWHADIENKDNAAFIWQLSSVNIPSYYLKEENLIQTAPATLSLSVPDILSKLPDKGKYSALLIYYSLKNQWLLLNNEKLFSVSHMSYLTGTGLRVGD